MNIEILPIAFYDFHSIPQFYFKAVLHSSYISFYDVLFCLVKQISEIWL